MTPQENEADELLPRKKRVYRALDAIRKEGKPYPTVRGLADSLGLKPGATYYWFIRYLKEIQKAPPSLH